VTDQPRKLEKIWPKVVMSNHRFSIEMDIRKASDMAFLCDEPIPRDTRMALRRKLNGDTR